MDANKYENSIEQLEVELDAEEIRWEDISDEDLEARISKDNYSNGWNYYC